MTAERWCRDVFFRACARRGLLDAIEAYLEPKLGWALGDVWGLHREGGRWQLTHLPTGMSAASSFERLADGKRFAEEMAAEVECRIGRLGKGLRRVRGAPAFLAALRAKRRAWGQPEIVPVLPPGSVEYGPCEVPR